MKVVIQRVSRASVTIEQKTKASIHNGLLIFLGIGYADTQEDIDYLVKKTVQMRIFDDAEGVMNLSVKDIDGDVLVVSQFTLMASCKKGNRPSYIEAAKPDISIPLYKAFCKGMSEAMGKVVETGEFGADMQVELVNNGPVTICLDSKDRT